MKNLFAVLMSVCLLALVNVASATDSSMIRYQSMESDQTFEQLPLSTDIEMHVNSVVSRVSVKQTFQNNSSEWLEGVYQFPLPEDAAVDTLKMYIGQRIIEGEIQEKERAERTYQQAKNKGQRASIVHQSRANLFTTKLANIAPGESITIEIEFQSMVSMDSTMFSLRMPLGITPRYQPSRDALRNDEAHHVASYKNATEAKSKASINNTVLSSEVTGFNTGSQPNRPVTVKVFLNPGFDLSLLESPYHEVYTQQHGDSYEIELENPTQANRDFILNWQPQLGQDPKIALFSESKEDYNYHVLMMLPPTHTLVGEQAQPREMIFVIDSSGSMSGESMQQAKAGLLFALEQLGSDDTFNIIDFDHEATKLFPNAVANTSETIQLAEYFVKQLDADGGTEIAKAVDMALDKPEAERLRQIVFLTDGSIGNEAQVFELIENKLGNNRLFTVGIGSAPNSYFMNRAANFGRGTYTYIGNINEVQGQLETLFKKLRYPALTNLRLAGGEQQTIDMQPSVLRDLYLGEPLFAAYRTSKNSAISMKVTGQSDVYQWSKNIPVVVNGKDKGIAKLWARQKIAAINADFGLGYDEKRQQILDTALEFHLMSDYTSLVAVDKTPARIREALKQKRLKNPLPKGWKNPHGYPRGGTVANLAMVIGFISLLLAMTYQLTVNRRRKVRASTKH
ncbi:marine proteobacterial sortase target protein [Kangiella sediminilitoris]|uniref:Vault protein inter-alpha-trypsin domain protein n=1 Tax=Kangiella sediminilitoris TaxID=1144748 RepID=A0A1B3B804_9GAMM|nr:marine proteobacterial sortase target protein [Kangiella sediminilitoris]AOE48907.1 Vault protein inter-alpha-trypsin domain protein [Kangiella sediminilitoris]